MPGVVEAVRRAGIETVGEAPAVAPYDVSPVVFLWLAVFLAAMGALATFGAAVTRWRTYRTIDALEPTDVEAVDSTGPVELEGRVVADDTFEEPLTGQPAVVAAWQVEE